MWVLTLERILSLVASTVWLFILITYIMNIGCLIFSMLALGFSITSIMCADKTKILFFQLPANICYSLSYMLGGLWVAGIGVVVATIRTAIFFAYTSRSKATPIGWLVIFLVLTMLCGLIDFRESIDILPIVGMGCFTYATWQTNERFLKLGAVVLSICLLIFNIISGMYIGALQECLLLISACYSIKKSPIL